MKHTKIILSNTSGFRYKTINNEKFEVYNKNTDKYLGYIQSIYMNGLVYESFPAKASPKKFISRWEAIKYVSMDL